jgi:hypothetical protein
VGAFDNPAASLFARVISLFIQLLAAGLYIELIIVNPAGGQRWEADVGRIGAERFD